MTPGDTHMHGLGRDDLLTLPMRYGFEMVETNLMASVYGKGHVFGRCLGRCTRDGIVLFTAKRRRNV